MALNQKAFNKAFNKIYRYVLCQKKENWKPALVKIRIVAAMRANLRFRSKNQTDILYPWHPGATKALKQNQTNQLIHGVISNLSFIKSIYYLLLKVDSFSYFYRNL